ncbi:MAG TPA: enoyl-CoA hydratase family protein [Streptosporangiaceae bacterium]|nr:enoyl-CoA hydratase family protein [Streptosporangiaceae bacterium]
MSERRTAGRAERAGPFRGSAPFTGEWRHFRVEHAAQAATVTFTRPDKLNALTFEAYADLRDLLAELPHRGDTRALVLRGEGKAFCSGGDVHEIIGETLKMAPDDLIAFTRMTGEVVRAMRECPIPIIAAVHGTAAGAGAVLALAADFRLVARSARFAFLFTKVGLAGADMGAAYLLPRLVGLGRATQLLMLGDTVDAAAAERYGLVTQLVDDDALGDAAAELARRLAAGPALAYAQTKALLSRELDMSLSGALELDAMTQALLMKSADYAEFHAAFTARRSPDWQGR